MSEENQKISWYQSPVSKEKMKELTARKTLQPLLHVLGHILVSAATGGLVVLAYLYLYWPFIVLAVFIHGTFFNFLGMFTGIHELSHGTVFKAKWLGKFFYFILGILTWNNIYKFRLSHFQHHLVTCYEGRDLEVKLPERFKKIDWLFSFTVTPVSGAGGIPGIFSLIPDTFRYAFGHLKEGWETMLLPEDRKKERRQVFNYARITLIVHIALAAYFIWSGWWILLFVVTFGSFFAPWLAILCALPQHLGLKGNDPDWRLCARTILLGPIARFFYWNMNYHIEHHMFASVPFYNLPKLRREIEKDLPKATRGLFKVWKELKPVIRKQREDPTYFVAPELPGKA